MPALRLRSGQAPAGIQCSRSLGNPLWTLFRQRANYAQSSYYMSGPRSAMENPPPHRDIFKSAVTGLDFTFMELFTKVFGLPDSKGDNRQGRVCAPARGKLASV